MFISGSAIISVVVWDYHFIDNLIIKRWSFVFYFDSMIINRVMMTLSLGGLSLSVVQ